jgi:hypothetical protein
MLALPFVSIARAQDQSDAKVNLQWSICDQTPESVLQKLAITDSDATKTAKITYYDSNPPTYIQQGLAFRSKDKKNKMESEVKVRFPTAQIGTPDGVDCSWERYGSQEVYSCEDKGVSQDGLALWSDDQTAFVGMYSSVNWDNLVGFGPFENPKWSTTIAGQDAVFDSVDTQVGHLMEVEIGADKADDDSTYQAVTQALTQAGVELCPVQEGKTFRLFRLMGLLPAQS